MVALFLLIFCRHGEVSTILLYLMIAATACAAGLGTVSLPPTFRL
jgi:hypothetical protein